MDIACFLTAFVGVFLAANRSLGMGFLAMIAVGYFNGVVRANLLGVFSTFMFDAGVLGMYAGFLRRRPSLPDAPDLGIGKILVLFLIAWPILVCLVPVNNYLIQLVSLRANIWFLPVLLIATRLTTSDLDLITRGLAFLNMIALLFGVYLYIFGVEALYPRNAITLTIYTSKDVGGGAFHRIPSSFLSAHAYGGTMSLTVPFLIDRLIGFRVRFNDKILAMAGLAAAAGGILMCGARFPILTLVMSLGIAWVLSRCSLKLLLATVVLVGVAFVAASSDERLSRVSTAANVDTIADRIALSVNQSFIEIFLAYPFGAGLGAGGTSIPFFLAHLAPEPIGLENEYSRMIVELGWIGLASWVMFLAWIYMVPPPSRPPAPWRMGSIFMYSLTLVIWISMAIGTGALTSIPGTILILTQMGVLISIRSNGTVPEDHETDLDFLEEEDEDDPTLEDANLGALHR